MSPKAKSRLVDQPPSASSSEDEQVEESQEEEEQSEEGQEEESGEETEEDEPPKKPITHKPVQTPQKSVQSSSESGTENGSGSESESDSGQSLPSPSASDFTVKPSVPVKAAAAPAKRQPPPQEPTQKDSKDSRRKKPKIAEEEEKKAAATPRSLWSDDDQVALLKGVVEYKEQKGTEPNADMSAFYEYIKGKLEADVSKSQLSEKLRRLKKKFMTNVKDGEDPVFTKSQDLLVFEYSKKIWGAPSNNVVKENVSNSTNGKAKKVMTVAVKKSAEPKKSGKVSTLNKVKDVEKRKEEEQEKQVAVKEVVKEDIVMGDQQDFQSKYPSLAASFESMSRMSMIYPNGTSWLKEKMSSIASDKAKVLEEEWKKLHDAEGALMLKRLDLIREHCGLVVDATRGN